MQGVQQNLRCILPANLMTQIMLLLKFTETTIDLGAPPGTWGPRNFLRPTLPCLVSHSLGCLDDEKVLVSETKKLKITRTTAGKQRELPENVHLQQNLPPRCLLTLISILIGTLRPLKRAGTLFNSKSRELVLMIAPGRWHYLWNATLFRLIDAGSRRGMGHLACTVTMQRKASWKARVWGWRLYEASKAATTWNAFTILGESAWFPYPSLAIGALVAIVICGSARCIIVEKVDVNPRELQISTRPGIRFRTFR